MCGNTGLDADDFTDENHGNDLFLHVNYLCKPLSLFVASVYVLYWKSILLFSPHTQRTSRRCAVLNPTIGPLHDFDHVINFR